VVYLASDEKVLSRLVVVKVLLDEKISHKWSVRKFKQEMEALARIDHPSVIGIFDSGQLADGRPYLVMQYVDGVSLRSVINVEGMDLFRAAEHCSSNRKGPERRARSRNFSPRSEAREHHAAATG
jgi:serine/threonine protein kinase